MNAVNLAPAGSTRRQRSRPTVSLSGASLGLVGGLFMVLLATFLFVSAHDRVTSRRAELSELQAGAAQWTAAASGFNGQVQQYTERSRSLADVRQLIAERYHWSLLLSQVAGLIPANVQLSSLQASTPAAAAAAALASPTGTSSSNGVTVAGCAASHSVVAQAMVSLHRVTGIANVVLTSSAKGAAASAGSVSTDTSGGSTGGCPLPVQFQLTLVFSAAAAAPPATASAADAASTDSGTGVSQ